MASVPPPRLIPWRAENLQRQRRCTSSLEGLPMMAGKSFWALTKRVNISLGEDMVVMEVRGHNSTLVVASLLLEAS